MELGESIVYPISFSLFLFESLTPFAQSPNSCPRYNLGNTGMSIIAKDSAQQSLVLLIALVLWDMGTTHYSSVF